MASNLTGTEKEISRLWSLCNSTRSLEFEYRLEFLGFNPKTKRGRSAKFWEVRVNADGVVTRRWGAIGQEGQQKVEPKGQAAFRYAIGLAIAKVRKGYMPVNSGSCVSCDIEVNRLETLERIAPLMNEIPVEPFLTMAEETLNALAVQAKGADYLDRGADLLQNFVRNWTRATQIKTVHESVHNGVRWFYDHLASAVFGGLMEAEERGYAWGDLEHEER